MYYTVAANKLRSKTLLFFPQILGAVLIGVGSWAIARGDTFSFVTGSNVFSGAALLIVAGIVTVLICATGIFGAIFKLRPILVIVSRSLSVY